VLVSRKTQHTAELDCIVKVRIPIPMQFLAVRMGILTTADGRLRIAIGRPSPPGLFVFLAHLASRGQAHT
jgi:hypothetical protein